MSAPQNKKAKEFFTEWSTSPSKGAEQQDYKRVMTLQQYSVGCYFKEILNNLALYSHATLSKVNCQSNIY